MNIFKQSLKLSSSIIVAAVISFFLCVSMNVICNALFTTVIGYDAFVYTDQSCETLVDEYEYIYTDENEDGVDEGVDNKKKEYENDGKYVVTQKKLSELKGTGKAVFLVTTQLFSIIMVIAFASGSVYKQGFKDRNLSNIGHIKKDLAKGFKIGIIGNVPFVALLVFAVITADEFRSVLYAFLNSHYYSFIMWIVKGKATLSQLGIMQFVLLALLQFIVPVISGIAYILGFKEINLAEKIIYKKEEK